MTIEQLKLNAVEQFRENQTMDTLQDLRNLGIGTKKLENNKWIEHGVYKLPFKRFVCLYDDIFGLTDIGVY
jgi:hypothetical protein